MKNKKNVRLKYWFGDGGEAWVYLGFIVFWGILFAPAWMSALGWW